MHNTTTQLVLLFGLGVELSYEKARRLYELAAQQEEVSAMANLGVMYEHGQGVEQSYKRAFKYITTNKRHIWDIASQYNLGNMISK